MSQEVLDIARQQATEALTKLDVQAIAFVQRVAESVLRQAAYWEKPIVNDEKLLFVRFFSPVVQREEVFLGNICSLAGCKQRYFNVCLLDVFIESLALDPTWEKSRSAYDTLRTYGAIAA
ncbi:MAG: hypothetical protein QXP01_06795 [Candidatus Hadarchaeum sp.]